MFYSKKGKAFPKNSRTFRGRGGILGFLPYFDIRKKLIRQICQFYERDAIYRKEIPWY